MIDFKTAIELGEEVFASLDRLYQLLNPATTGAERTTNGATAVPSLLEFRRRLLAVHASRHLVTELAATGKMSTSEAQAMVDAGASTSERPGAAGTAFANILSWLETNGPTIAQDIAAAVPIIISLITLFGG